MSNATDLSDAFSVSSGGTFITKDEKAEVFAEQTPMYVVHVEPASEGQWGVQTIFHVKAAKWGKDETRLLAFTHNEYRQRLAEAMQQLMAANPGKPGGPIYLWKWVTKTGHEAWDIKPQPYTGVLLNQQPQATTPSTPAQAAPATPTISDDDLPF